MRLADEADKTGRIRAANAAYSAMQPLYRAAGYVNAARQREGAFTPQELLTATAAENRRRFQRGTAPFQQEAMAGAEMLQQQRQQRQNILGQVGQGMDTGYAGKLIPPVASIGTMAAGNVSPTMAAVGAAPSLFCYGIFNDTSASRYESDVCKTAARLTTRCIASRRLRRCGYAAKRRRITLAFISSLKAFLALCQPPAPRTLIEALYGLCDLALRANLLAVLYGVPALK